MRHSNIIDLRKISCVYGTRTILKDITFSIPQGVRCAVVGPNGAGKTTLLKNLLGFLQPLHGNISFLNNLTFREFRKSIAYVPQKSSINMTFPTTVFDIVMMGTYADLKWYQSDTKSMEPFAWKALERVQLSHVAHMRLSSLSGGQQQRVFIARALVQNALLYIMDEPFAGVDKVSEQTISQIFFKLQDEGKTVFVVHHDWHTLYEYYDWIIALNKTLMYAGPAKDFTQDLLDATYKEAPIHD